MSLQFTLLTMLKQKPQTGYGIVKDFEDAVGFFWQATHQQVYRELGKLSDLGLVKFKEVKQDDKPDKKIYRISSAGKKALNEWVLSPLREVPNKQPLLVKLQNLDEGNAESLQEELNREKEKVLGLQRIYNNIEQQHYTSKHRSKLSPDELMLYAALRRGIHGTDAQLKWLDETIQLIGSLFKSK